MKKMATILFLLLAAGFYAGGVFAGDFQELAVRAAALKDLASAQEVASPEPDRLASVEWVTIPGGSFLMGTNEDTNNFLDAQPVHRVNIRSFAMSKTLVTVEQYAECVLKGACSEPGSGADCNWGVPGRQRHPINCVDWAQAAKFAKFKGARLPSESEWEYAARSGGKNQKYPWGNAQPNCETTVMYGRNAPGCGANSTMAVCSKPKGNTAQGLCDMAGNVFQWVQDQYGMFAYATAPVDGGAFQHAFQTDATARVVRGGAYGHKLPDEFRADKRFNMSPANRIDAVGFRLAR